MWVAGFAVCFEAIFYFSGASLASAPRILIVAAGAMIGFGLIQSIPRLPKIGSLPRIGRIAVILVIAAATGFVPAYFFDSICKASHVSPAVLDCIIWALEFLLLMQLVEVLFRNPAQTVSQERKPARE